MSRKNILATILLALVLSLARINPEPVSPLGPFSSDVAKANEDVSPPGQVVDGFYERNWLIWEELVPPEWKPEKIFEDLKINDMADNDPRVDQALDEFLKRWNAAPVNQKINNRPIKIPGFVVPLDFEKTEIEEFLLVPYFGACIHVPPPPPNQIIYVKAKKPVKGLTAMEVVWVYGKIRIEKYDFEQTNAGYSIAADRVEIYQVSQ
ncbi:MAG: DUF3299 domain-containing protein [Deltaproteobacteria bacterium]|nr:DUF3299 domain-containing protein [Deltaproteobacteria bacterium]